MSARRRSYSSTSSTRSTSRPRSPGRAKHFYSIYDKMARKGREFNEIYDLTAMRVIVERSGDEGTRDCYGALGLIHSLWKPMPGRFKDFIAMPKFNGYRALHTTVIGPQGRPLEIQVRTNEMHATAEYGVAAHWIYKGGRRDTARRRVDAVGEPADGRRERTRTTRRVHEDVPHRPLRRGGARLHAEGPGQDAARPARRRSTSPTPCTPTSATTRSGAKVNGRIVPLHYKLKNGDIVEILTSKQERGPVARLAVAREELARAQQDPAVVHARDARGSGGEGPRVARARAEAAEPAVREAAPLGGARRR